MAEVEVATVVVATEMGQGAALAAKAAEDEVEVHSVLVMLEARLI